MSDTRLFGPALAGAVVVGALIVQPASPGPSAAAKAPQAKGSHHVMLTADELKWADGPPGLPTGTRFAVLEGDPSKPGPFTIRGELQPNTKILPHTHPGIEHVTVLSGELYMGSGDKLDEEKAKKLGPGGFAVMPIQYVHYAFTKGPKTVIQLHGMGPWGINYLNPADDPRRAEAKK
ncbi:MAG: cupin domain-containing protein [Deltaproteobacteria bacterium]|nr:cupin domain-containing protein [Deltaproteobacteria bacterium]